MKEGIDKKVAFIIRGHVASGKTTLARELAAKHRLKRVGSDFFHLALFPYKDRSVDDVLQGFQDYLSAVRNTIGVGRSLIIEGDLLPLRGVDRFGAVLSVFAGTGYEIRRLLLTVSEEESARRRAADVRTISDKDVKRIKDGIEATATEADLRIDTSDITTHEKFARAETLLGLR